MLDDRTRLKQKAEKYFEKGKWRKALEAFLALSEKEPADLRLRLKISECLLRLDRQHEAQVLFRQVADLYGRDGQFLKAIAVHQRLLEIDRTDREARAQLAALYEKQGTASLRELPVAPDDVERTIGELSKIAPLQDIETLQKKFVQAQARSDWTTALEVATQLWRLQPGDMNIRVDVARILIAQSRHDQADAVLFSVAGDFLKRGNLLRAVFLQALLSEQNGRVKRRELQTRLGALLSRLGERHPEKRGVWFEKLKARSEIMDEMLTDLLVDPIDLAKIKPIALLSQLPRKALDGMLESLTALDFKKGDAVFRQGESTDRLFWIASGTVALYGTASERFPENDSPVFTVSDGELFGAVGFLFDGRQRLSAWALDTTEVLVLHQSSARRLMQEFPEISAAFDALYREQVLLPSLLNHPYFRSFGERRLRAVAAAFQNDRPGEGGWIVQEGERSERIYFVREGTVDLLAGKETKGKTLASLTPGQFFSELDCLSGRVSALSYKGGSTTRLMSLRPTELPSEMRELLGERERLFEALQARLRAEWGDSLTPSAGGGEEFTRQTNALRLS